MGRSEAAPAAGLTRARVVVGEARAPANMRLVGRTGLTGVGLARRLLGALCWPTALALELDEGGSFAFAATGSPSRLLARGTRFIVERFNLACSELSLCRPLAGAQLDPSLLGLRRFATSCRASCDLLSWHWLLASSSILDLNGSRAQLDRSCRLERT